MTFGDWHAYYRDSDGGLVSVGSDDAPASRGHSRVAISGRPGKFDVWNSSTHEFEDKTTELVAAREAERAAEADYRAALEVVRQAEESR